MTPANIEKFYKRLSKAEPRPQTELNYTNAYTLLVAVILSAQATDRGVNKATALSFFPRANSQGDACVRRGWITALCPFDRSVQQ